MLQFCPECSNLLRKQRIDSRIFFVCKCGYQEEIINDTNRIERSIQKKKQALERNLLILSQEDQISVHPKIKKDCPKCDNKEVETWQKQMRSADEPSTHFFRCTKCKNTWRE